MLLRSEIVLPVAAMDLDYPLSDVPNGIPAIVHDLVKMRGRATEEGCGGLAAVAGSAVAVLGQERAYQLLATQFVAAEE